MARAEDLGHVAEHFRRAATGAASWHDALNGFADALGTRTGQLIAVGRSSLIPLNIMTRMPDESAVEFAELDGGNPRINSRVRLGAAAPEMTFLDQADFDPEGDRQRSPEFGAWIDRYEIGYTCITTLVKQPGMLIGLAALRSTSQGWMSDEEKGAFMALAGHIRAAVMLRNSVEEQAVDLLAAALDGVDAAAAICDGTGRIRAMTQKGEALISAGRFARLVDGHLVPHRPTERLLFQGHLSAALQSRVHPEIAPPQPIVLTSELGDQLVLEVLPLPTDHSFTFAASVMIVFRGESDPAERRAAIARELFGLTRAEERVAASMLRGRSPAEIAADTGTSTGTVRNHVHRILTKSMCGSQVQFLATMGRYE